MPSTKRPKQPRAPRADRPLTLPCYGRGHPGRHRWNHSDRCQLCLRFRHQVLYTPKPLPEPPAS